MIIAKHIASKFVEWDDNITKSGKAFFWASSKPEIALLKDANTGEVITDEYYLLIVFKLEIDDDKSSKTVFTAVYKSQYSVKFEKGEPELNDFVKLFNETKDRMNEEFKSKMQNQTLPKIEISNLMKVISNLFENELPKHNLR